MTLAYVDSKRDATAAAAVFDTSAAPAALLSYSQLHNITSTAM